MNIIIHENLKRKVNLTMAFYFIGHSFLFETDTGVFSKSEVDFGSRLLIDTFNMPDVEGIVLDVGCGYGPIGLAIAKQYPERTVYMMDINERALQLARKMRIERNSKCTYL